MRRSSILSDGGRTLTVRLPAGKNVTYLKKSEQLAKDLPAAMLHALHDGDVLHLARPVTPWAHGTCICYKKKPWPPPARRLT